MKYVFIVNPTAGGSDRTEQVRAQAETVFPKHPDDSYEIYITKSPMDAAEAVKTYAGTGGHLRILACGGDGTFNECVCGAAGFTNVAVSPFPVGTGNDFCRMFGDEKDLFRDLDALVDGTEHAIDLIDCNGRYSANICSVGFDARVGTNVHKYSSWPVIGGSAGYVVSAIVEAFKGLNRHMDITCGGASLSGEFALACVCNGRFYGGGFNPSPDAMPDDGELDIYIVKKASLLTFAKDIGKYASGRASELPDDIIHLKGDSITIAFNENSVVNIDGEAVFTEKAVIKLLPKALNIIVPKGMTFFGQTGIN